MFFLEINPDPNPRWIRLESCTSRTPTSIYTPHVRFVQFFAKTEFSRALGRRPDLAGDRHRLKLLLGFTEPSAATSTRSRSPPPSSFWAVPSLEDPTEETTSPTSYSGPPSSSASPSTFPESSKPLSRRCRRIPSRPALFFFKSGDAPCHVFRIFR